jgi:hypothetical protein
VKRFLLDFRTYYDYISASLQTKFIRKLHRKDLSHGNSTRHLSTKILPGRKPRYGRSLSGGIPSGIGWETYG